MCFGVWNHGAGRRSWFLHALILLIKLAKTAPNGLPNERRPVFCPI